MDSAFQPLSVSNRRRRTAQCLVDHVLSEVLLFRRWFYAFDDPLHVSVLIVDIVWHIVMSYQLGWNRKLISGYCLRFRCQAYPQQKRKAAECKIE